VSEPTENKSSIETTYQEHHASRQRYGFGYRLEDRGPRLAQWIGTDKTVLDLGCRDGTLTSYYTAGNRVTGVDIDREALAAARKNLGIETTWLDVASVPLPFASASFMVVVAAELLEHLPYPQRLVQDVLRILTPGGLFVGSVPNAFHWRKRLAFLGGRTTEDPTHLRLFSVAALRQLLAAFSSIQIVPVGGIGGGLLPVVPVQVSGALIRLWPQMLANDLLFCAVAPRGASRGSGE
jgi:SAM-dependent methyltransferase